MDCHPDRRGYQNQMQWLRPAGYDGPGHLSEKAESDCNATDAIRPLRMTDRMNQQTCKHFLCYDIIAFVQSDMERSVCFVRKAVFLIILGLLLGLYAVAVADTECSLAPCSGSLTIPDSKYIIVTPENIGEHTDIMTVIGKTKEEIISDWEDRGVVLQAWFNSKALDAWEV